MNNKEFKALDDKFFTKLKVELAKRDADFKILQRDPFNGSLTVGVFYKNEPDFFECYSYTNNGDVVDYSFLGHSQSK